MMVPAGKITEDTFETLLGLAAPGDVIVDGGNSNFHDSQRRYADAKEKGINFVDAGVSGGVWGLANGYCLMVGGDADAVAQVEPVFRRPRARRRLRARRRRRRGALREDGPQRDRVRADAGVRRGLRGDEEVGVRSRPARDRGHLALRIGRALVAARAAARRVRGRRARSSRRSAATSTTRARAAGRSTRRSPRTCPCR